MKKVIALVLILTSAMTFFCATVFADSTELGGYIGEVHNSVTLATDVTANVRATQFSPVIGEEIVDVSGSPGIKVYDAYTSVIVVVRFTNSTSSNYVINQNVNLSLYYDYSSSFPNSYGITKGYKEITNYTDQVYLMYYGTNVGEIRLTPSVDWSYNDKIVIPANSSITCIAELKINAYYVYDSQGYHAKYPTLNAIGIGSPTASSTSYNPIGASGGGMSQSQITSMLNYLDSIDASSSNSVSNLQDIENNTDQIENLLNQLKTVLTWNGTLPTVTYNTLGQNSFSGTINDQINYSGIRSRSGVYPILDTTDIESPNVVYRDIVYKHSYTYYVHIRNYGTSKTVQSSIYIDLADYVSSIIGFELVAYDGEYLVHPFLTVSSNKIRFYMYPSAEVPALPAGSNYFIFTVNFYSYSPVSSFVLAPTITLSSQIVDYDDNVDTGSTQIVNQSNQIHTQEQLYFEQNAQAIQATGLGNYQFSTNQASGVQAVTSDFNSLFNALGTWKNVYIFSITLGLALTIIRYSPNSTSRKIRNEMSE